MKQVLGIVANIEEEIVRLEAMLAAIEVGDGSPGRSHVARMKVLIADLKREIELNTPQPK